MSQHILSVAGAEVEPPQDLEQLRLETVNIGLQGSVLAGLAYNRIDFLPCFGDDILNTCRVNASVKDQLCQCDTCYSRRTGSKPERITASGVSSMIRSTPVAASSARMFRPSRPMMK